MGLFSKSKPKYDPHALKYLVKSSLVRINTSKATRLNTVVTLKAELARHLQAKQLERAKIKAEAIFREQRFVEAYELLEIFLQRVQGSMHVMAESPAVPEALK
ncbi:hypothetical protein KIPB_006836, partial [Kipferlia bialata]|eukprot:g6836.t1